MAENEVKRKKVTVNTLWRHKKEKKKTVFLTAYDFPTAYFADAAGVDMILVGDSGGMTKLGYKTTLPVTMDNMMQFAGAVVRGSKYAFVVGDMPFGSYQPSDELAVVNAQRFIREGCDAIKLEGGVEMAPRVKAMSDAGILVMGHIGLTPQSTAKFGGYRVQGKTNEAIDGLVKNAEALRDAGAFSVLLEAIPPEAGKAVTERVENMIIYGIGAGPDVDGQLVISDDMLGTFAGTLDDKGTRKPRFVKRYADLGALATEAISAYAREVRDGTFPAEEHCYKMAEEPDEGTSTCNKRE